MKSYLLAWSFLFLAMQGFTQTPGQNKTVDFSADAIGGAFPIVSMKFSPSTGDSELYRKPLSSPNWGAAFAVIPGGPLNNWNDVTVETGETYEYRIVRPGAPSAFGYICAGVEVPEALHRGTVLLVYDTISTAGLEPELARWMRDVEGDGWNVLPIAIDQNDAVTEVKARVVNAWQADPQQVRSVLLFGQVPVPYSGNIVPDGHIPDHQGAWPADGYYADMDGNWTDISVNNTGASQLRNQNVPGDGKFDQNTFPSTLELQIGRVDMRNLPAFSQSETELLRRYLDKNHAYRNKHFSTVNRGLIDDNFSGMLEGFSAAGWRNFNALCGADNIVTTDYFNTMKVEPYQWSYGCGPGSYTSCSGVGNTAAFAADSIQSIFTMLFGSYFGDWDSPSNNLLRAALANGSTLANCWAGRPFWHFHHMGLGFPIGYSALQSMNNINTYDANNSQRGVHMALMGDPTLRAHVLAPAQNLLASFEQGQAQLSWDASADNVLGYNLYRRFGESGPFEKLNSEHINGLQYVDSELTVPGVYQYMVRSVVLEVTNTGSYYNEGTGVFDTLDFPGLVAVEDASAASPDFTVFPNPSSGQVQVRLNTWAATEVALRVYDSRGQALLQQQLSSAQTMVDLSPYPAGLYIFSVESAAGVQVRRVLKQ